MKLLANTATTFQKLASRKALATTLLALGVTLGSTAATAQEPGLRSDSGASVPTEPDSFSMNMREADIRAFIQWIADRTGKNILVHRSVRGTVTVIASTPVTANQAYELFLTVLQMNGFAAVEIEGGGIKVIPDAEAKTTNTPFDGEAQARGEIVTAVLEIEYSDPATFVQVLRPLVPPTAHLAAYNPTNSLIVADTARGLDRIKELINILDQREAEFDVEIVPVIHASADELIKIIEDVMKAGSPGGGEGGPASTEVNLAVDERSNSILLTGNVTKRQQVKNLIKRLDTPLDGNGNTRVVYLNYIEATEIQPILESVGDSLLKETKTEGIKSFTIQSSETNNALIISAPPAVMNSLQSVIRQLDIQRAQVLVEAVVVRITGNIGDDIGLVGVGSDTYDEPLDGSVFGVNNSGNSGASDVFGVVAGAGDDVSTSEALAGALGGAPGFTYGYLEDGNLIAALRAVSSRNKSNIMSTPTVVALDNEEASLLVGQNVPFITGSATSSGSSVTNPFQTIERQDVGVTLNITPRINQGDSITLEIEQTTENVSTTSTAGASDLITDKTEIKTSALIKDGQVLVIGGLMSETETDTRSQIPILGDIPWAGKLFRSSSKRKEKQNLMVFIKPTILKEQLAIAGVTAERYAFMRELQMTRAMATFLDYGNNATLEEFEEFAPQDAAALKAARRQLEQNEQASAADVIEEAADLEALQTSLN